MLVSRFLPIARQRTANESLAELILRSYGSHSGQDKAPSEKQEQVLGLRSSRHVPRAGTCPESAERMCRGDHDYAWHVPGCADNP